MAAKRSARPARTREQEAAQIRRRVVLLTLAVAAVVVAFVIGYLSQQPPTGADAEDLFRLESQPMAGDPEAPVTVVEFGDFKCPFCARFTTEVYPELKKAYVDTGKARFYFINFAFIGPDSFTAAAAGEAIYAQDPEAFWDFYEALYAHQGPENQAWATPEFLLDLARRVAPHLDFEALEQALDDGRYRARVEEDIQIARRAGVNAVPALFVNGKPVEDWTLDGMRAAIEAALKAEAE